ncbi:hypothetical protein ACWIFK_06470 [Streptomyces althioticus]
MGLDVTVLIADPAWLTRVPTRERLPRLRSAWYADETGLWGHDDADGRRRVGMAAGAWVPDVDAFVDLLTQWGHVLTEAARHGWCLVGLSE